MGALAQHFIPAGFRVTLFCIIITQGIKGIPPLRTFTTHPDTAYGVSFIAVSMDHDLLSHKDLLDITVAQQLDTFRQNSISSSRKREEKKGKSYLLVLILVLLFLVNPGTQTILVYSLFHLQIIST